LVAYKAFRANVFFASFYVSTSISLPIIHTLINIKNFQHNKCKKYLYFVGFYGLFVVHSV